MKANKLHHVTLPEAPSQVKKKQIKLNHLPRPANHFTEKTEEEGFWGSRFQNLLMSFGRNLTGMLPNS